MYTCEAWPPWNRPALTSSSGPKELEDHLNRQLTEGRRLAFIIPEPHGVILVFTEEKS